jgi:hypothetical protein
MAGISNTNLELIMVTESTAYTIVAVAYLAFSIATWFVFNSVF